MKALEFLIAKFSRLKAAIVDGDKAPHKPILLLSVIQCLEKGEIKDNRIYITPGLVARFRDNWHHLVTNKRFAPNFALPFFHLTGRPEEFWFIKTIQGREIALTTSRSIKSFAHLKEVVDYGYFDNRLFALLMNAETREVLKQTLLTVYFNIRSFSVLYSESLVAEAETDILCEAPTVYKTKAQEFDEEEIFVRSGIFKKVVPQIYNYTCSVSGMRIIASREVQMTDACHLIPFSESRDDTISNGISLCPNLHRAFDRGLIAIDNDYKVLVSDCFWESTADYSIKQYEGRQLLLPKERRYFPSVANLEWHRGKVFVR